MFLREHNCSFTEVFLQEHFFYVIVHTILCVYNVNSRQATSYDAKKKTADAEKSRVFPQGRGLQAGCSAGFGSTKNLMLQAVLHPPVQTRAGARISFVVPSLLLLQETEARLPASKAQIDKEKTLPRVNSSLFDEAQRISPRILAVERSLAPGADDDSASRRIVNVFRG